MLSEEPVLFEGECSRCREHRAYCFHDPEWKRKMPRIKGELGYTVDHDVVLVVKKKCRF